MEFSRLNGGDLFTIFGDATNAVYMKVIYNGDYYVLHCAIGCLEPASLVRNKKINKLNISFVTNK